MYHTTFCQSPAAIFWFILVQLVLQKGQIYRRAGVCMIQERRDPPLPIGQNPLAKMAPIRSMLLIVDNFQTAPRVKVNVLETKLRNPKKAKLLQIVKEIHRQKRTQRN